MSSTPGPIRLAIGASPVVALSLGLLLSLAPPTAAASHTVTITDSAFAAPVLNVTVGDTVTWVNADDRPHTVTSRDGSFDSDNLDEGASWSFTFTEPGTYEYLCEYHPDMRATIVVEPASVAPAAGTPAPTADAGAADASADDPATAAHGGDHAGADAGSEQPNTAMPAPDATTGVPAASWVLWGLALVIVAIGFAPLWRPRAGTVARPRGGWRR